MSIKSNIVARAQSIATKVKPHATRAGQWMLAHPHTMAVACTAAAVLHGQYRIANDADLRLELEAHPTRTKIGTVVGVVGMYWSTYDMVVLLDKISKD